MKRLDEIFDVKNSPSLELMNCEQVDNGICFVSRTSANNGIVARVKPLDELDPMPADAITVALGGSVLSSFYQDEPFYTAFHIACLYPKTQLTKEQMLYYAYVIEENKYRYNYGRQANRTLKTILVPDVDELPDYVNKMSVSDYQFEKEPIIKREIELDTENWKWFRYDEIFDIKKGFFNKKPDETLNGNIPFIGATDSNNGITSYHDYEVIESTSKTGEGNNAPIEDKLFEPNCITVSNNGSIGYAFYQPKEFTCTHDVNPLYLKNKELNIYIAMFLCSLIEMEKYRWAYGRKWRPVRMPSSLIKLPVTNDGTPDWQFMEDYIKSLPYSKNI
ncbi:MAG: restriction endonuclease subunit S [Bacteroidales bacterium]|jgi:hypothetical protein